MLPIRNFYHVTWLISISSVVKNDSAPLGSTSQLLRRRLGVKTKKHSVLHTFDITVCLSQNDSAEIWVQARDSRCSFFEHWTVSTEEPTVFVVEHYDDHLVGLCKREMINDYVTTGAEVSRFGWPNRTQRSHERTNNEVDIVVVDLHGSAAQRVVVDHCELGSRAGGQNKTTTWLHSNETALRAGRQSIYDDRTAGTVYGVYDTLHLYWQYTSFEQELFHRADRGPRIFLIWSLLFCGWQINVWYIHTNSMNQ